MKILQWLLYIILIPLWLLIGLIYGIWDSFGIGYEVIFEDVKTYRELSDLEKEETEEQI